MLFARDERKWAGEEPPDLADEPVVERPPVLPVPLPVVGSSAGLGTEC